jgi:ribonuclease-3
VLGAILLDGGVRAARSFVKRFILAKLPEGKVATEPVIDAKTRLLHHCQRQKIGQPRYELLEAIGLQHDQEFRVVVKLTTGTSAEGRARTKRAAEKLAAESLLAQLAAGQKA